MVVLVIISILMMGGVIYLAIAKNSTFLIRVVALGALALMVLAVIVCLVIFFRETATPKQMILLPDVDPADVPPQEGSNPLTLVMYIFFLLALFVMIMILSLRGQKRSSEKETEDKSFGSRW
ncbi:MAG: hypothetical protein LBG95_01830 [Treponema sp.]|jgi:hypothetical protein|nr:hypothetical protein [Treponema sp.]